MDHANCEKKAASTALALMFAYPEDRALGIALARLAREELRHFEQVQKLMARLKVPAGRLSPGRYAGALRAQCRAHEPARRAGPDALRRADRGAFLRAVRIAGAAIAGTHGLVLCGPGRGRTAPPGPVPVAGAALRATSHRCNAGELQRSLQRIAAHEAQLATSPDTQFRFHSGPPAQEWLHDQPRAAGLPVAGHAGACSSGDRTPVGTLSAQKIAARVAGQHLLSPSLGAPCARWIR